MSKCKPLVRMDWATTTAKDWGFFPVPCKGGKTTNSTIKEKKSGADWKGDRK